MQLPLLMGHRGAAALAPENTLAGVRAAKAAGVDWVELDVLSTADAVPVIHHDQTLARCFDDPRVLSAASADTLPAGLPRLDQMLTLLNELDMGVNLELKTYDDTPIDALVAGVAEVWQRCRPKGFLSSFSSPALKKAQEALPEVARAFITTPFNQRRIDEALRLGCFAVNVYHRVIGAKRVARAKADGLQVGVWTVNTVTEAMRCRQAGVDCVITDDPALLLSHANDL